MKMTNKTATNDMEFQASVKPSSIATTTMIDVDGDLVLVVGPDERRIVVSSKVLTLASKVFKAMLSRKFKEGTELSKRYGFLFSNYYPVVIV
jgi:hypothetical protein